MIYETLAKKASGN